MQQIKTAVAVFCSACICAELVGRLLGDVQGRRCIKAAAGLYILAALFHALPGVWGGAAAFELPDLPAASFGSAEELILRQAGQELADAFAEELAAAGLPAARLTVTLEKSPDGGSVGAAQAEAALPAGCTAEEKAAVRRLLCERLALEEQDVLLTADTEGGEGG